MKKIRDAIKRSGPYIDALIDYLEYRAKVELALNKCKECATCYFSNRCVVLDQDAETTLNKLWNAIEEAKKQPVTLLFTDNVTRDVSFEEFIATDPLYKEHDEMFIRIHVGVITAIRTHIATKCK